VRLAPLVLSLFAVAAACATRGPAAARREASARAEIRALEDEYLRERFLRQPEEATQAGWPGADHAAVADPRPEAVAAWERVEDGFLARARAVDARALAASPEAVTRGILLEALEGSRAARPCRGELWNVSSVGGWPGAYASLAEVQPVGTPAANAAARARLRGLAVRIDREVEALREGVRLGHLATRDNVERLLGELDRLLATPPAIWPFTRPAARAEDHAFLGELTEVVEREVLPAAQRYRDYLATEYRERARRRPGLLSLPGGEACYRGALRRMTGLEVEPAFVHDTGRARLEALHAEIRERARARFGELPVPELLRRLREDPALRFADREEILGVTRAAVERAAAALPRWLGRVPAAPVRVREYPEFRRASNPAESYTPDGSSGTLAGITFIDVFEPDRKPRFRAESVAFHEAIPGRHLQAALALERAGGPRIGKYLGSPAFGEGWALYAERLAAEMGLFSDDVARLGGLASEAFRAARLVVDTGLALQGWERPRAIEYLVENAGLSPELAASEVDRCTARPGEATSSLPGALEIRRLREEAERALGPRFDVRAFHDAVLEDGAVTLPLLRARIARFVREGVGGRLPRRPRRRGRRAPPGPVRCPALARRSAGPGTRSGPAAARATPPSRSVPARPRGMSPASAPSPASRAPARWRRGPRARSPAATTRP